MQIDNLSKTTTPEPIEFTWLTQGEELQPDGAATEPNHPVVDCYNCPNIGLAFLPTD